MRHFVHRLVVSLLLGLAVVALGAPSRAQLSEKEAVSQLKGAVKAELATLETGIKFRGEEAVADLVLALVAVDAGVADELHTAVASYLADLHALVDASMRNLEGNASTILANHGAQPPDFQLGSGGILDALRVKLAKGESKIDKKLQGTLGKIRKAIQKDVPNVRLNYSVAIRSLMPPPRPNLTAPVAPLRKLSMGPLFASSDASLADDGTLCAGGLADAAEGDVTVTITDPAGGTAAQVVSVAAQSGEWRACFATLAEGNYSVDATQAGGQSAQAAIGVP